MRQVILKMTKLEFINKFTAQWLFIRITRWVESNYWGYGLLFPVIPLTGWTTSYWPKEPKHFKIYKKRAGGA